MPKSKYDILNIGFGALNPEHDNLSGKNYNPDDESASFFSQGVKTIQDIVGATKSGDFHGPMVGICLRNEGRVSETGWVDPTCWAALSSDIVEEGSKMDLVQVRVRVPELHASKPIPRDLPDRLTVDSNHDVINQYPVFVSQFAGVSEPSAGDLVWIDFQNRNSQTGGIFLGIADASSIAHSEDSSEEKASKKFEDKGKGKVGGSKTSEEKDRYKYSLMYRNKNVLTGIFPDGITEEELKKRLPAGFFGQAGAERPYYDIVLEALKKHAPDMPITLVAALLQIESNFKYKAKSGALNVSTKNLIPYGYENNLKKGKKKYSGDMGQHGAKGLGQFMNVTSGFEIAEKYKGRAPNNLFRYLHDPYKPEENLAAAVKKMYRNLTVVRAGDPPTALHVYNAGAGNTPSTGTEISDKWANPRYPEKILRYFHHYQTGEILEKMP